jgi:Cu/Ag efflux protein CusF
MKIGIMKIRFEAAFAAAVVLASAPAIHAQAAQAGATAPAAMSTGEIKKVDKDTGKITIKHGPLQNLGMPAMTMVFHVANPAMLDQVKAGDKIAFIAEKRNGALTVTKMEAAN